MLCLLIATGNFLTRFPAKSEQKFFTVVKTITVKTKIVNYNSKNTKTVLPSFQKLFRSKWFHHGILFESRIENVMMWGRHLNYLLYKPKNWNQDYSWWKKSNSESKTVKRNNEDEIHTIVRGYIDKDKDVKEIMRIMFILLWPMKNTFSRWEDGNWAGVPQADSLFQIASYLTTFQISQNFS